MIVKQEPIVSEKISPITAFDKNGLKIVFQFERCADNPLTISITMIATNTTDQPMNDFLFQAAVPKVFFTYLKCLMFLFSNIFFAVIPTSIDASF